MAAVLACGPEAALSHDSAAALWRIGIERSDRVDVSVPVATDRRRPGVRLHRRRELRPEDRAEENGVPTTAPARTLVDLAGVLSPARLERAVNEADKHDLLDPESLRLELERFAGQRGAGRLRELLDRRTFRLSDSELERQFRPLARRAGLPEPLTKHWLNGFEVDFFWPGIGLVVETDGLRYHRTPSQQARALHRDQAHLGAGMTPLRFSHEQIRYEPRRVVASLLSVRRRLNED
jgi:very-short-patch-repair endonuclease